MIDVSDGLAGDLGQLCAASGVGAVIESERLPADPALWAVARTLAADLTRERAELLPAPERGIAEHLRLGPSDDYELLLAIDPGLERRAIAVAQATRTPFAMVGRFHDAPGVLTIRDAAGRTRPLPGGGWDHFRG
jgi:thiamine-monophosphate kinase